MGYVCAFRGRRDGYQVPIALAEGKILDEFFTDLYFKSGWNSIASILPRRIRDRFRSRCDELLPSKLVKQLLLTTLHENALRLVGRPSGAIYDRFDPVYGAVAAASARRNESNLFMYSSYASHAFAAPYRHDPHKVLFQFHPHYSFENDLLKRDRIASERAGIHFANQMENLHDNDAGERAKGDMAWQMADHIVCASDFTRRSLIDVGACPNRITIAPYGVETESIIGRQDVPNRSENFHALFVGSGIQRKGLHHLLLAWQHAQLPAGSRLTVVARVLDSGLSKLLKFSRGVELKAGVTKKELFELYAEATLFCMPSLVEGFGQVYLEALACGLPVLGTNNTCCPDLGTTDDGVFVTSPSNIDELVANLETLARSLPGNEFIRGQARSCAERFTWKSFRRKIQTVAIAKY